MKYEDVKVGMKVRVTGRFPGNKDGWDNSWNPEYMDPAIGKVFEVSRVRKFGVEFRGDPLGLGYPWQVLEPVVDEFKVGDKVKTPSGKRGTVDAIFYVVNMANFRADELTFDNGPAYDDDETMEALDGSIKKWEDILLGKAVDAGPDSCPLCKLFYHSRCEGCPVSDDTRKFGCSGTPYVGFVGREVTDKNIMSAYAMLNYLRGLKSKLTEEEEK